ncbi:unnamed protein product [Calypogeia fissa]
MLDNTCIEDGQVLCPSANHFSMLLRSYVCPVFNVTGSFISCREMGHMKKLASSQPVSGWYIIHNAFQGVGINVLCLQCSMY